MKCDACGNFIVSEEAWDDELSPLSAAAGSWTPVKRAALSHAIRQRIDLPMHPRHVEFPFLTSERLRNFRSESARLPTAVQQARAIIRFVGNHERETGEPLHTPPPHFYVSVGALHPSGAGRLLRELVQRGLINAALPMNEAAFNQAQLTLDGWEEWEKFDVKSGGATFGVIAMKFGDATLDALVEETIKPAVAGLGGLRLHRIDDPEIVRAGVIDNIMRETLREAAFLVADLSHANNGAYWEAGFVEGLGKPVIYLCERQQWDEQQTHFDTNHCTTLVWDKDDPEALARQLVATLRNSLR